MIIEIKNADRRGKQVSTKGSNSRQNGEAVSISVLPVWEYDITPESKDYIGLKDSYNLFIGGKHVRTKKYFDTINQSNEEVIACVAQASKDDVDKAVYAADSAYGNTWSEVLPNAFWLVPQIKSGVIWSNTFNKFNFASPFGGYKESGFGREGGLHALKEYLS